MSKNTIAIRVTDLEEQLIEKIRDKRFAIQVDEATDSNKDCLLIAYVRHINNESLKEGFLFCKYVSNRFLTRERSTQLYISTANLDGFHAVRCPVYSGMRWLKDEN